MPEPFKYGDRVRYGFTDGEVIRAEKGPRGIPGYIVQDFDSQNGYGAHRRAYPRWVPASSVRAASTNLERGLDALVLTH